MCAEFTGKGPADERPEDTHKKENKESTRQERSFPSPERMKAMMEACGCGPMAAEAKEEGNPAAMMTKMMEKGGCADMMRGMMEKGGCGCGPGAREDAPSQGEAAEGEGTDRCC